MALINFVEEKQDIVDSYKAKLKSIDCKHFDFGKGNCPFGSSCFYKEQQRIPFPYSDLDLAKKKLHLRRYIYWNCS
ncbi:E3 ubiquitin-protein ligase makorin-like [Quercus suber]|uniref:E3 ubiquitin-protein ligase makorin-like n=1 Tax=Quercus suber TaxID=58331 RepID=UPI000D26562C|nr:e3 ubiquitin-protein ligase makorin [Quercus suber]